MSTASSFYDLVEKDAKGAEVNFSKFKGKVVYGVNVASKCGYTASGYALLEKLSKMDGVEVLLFPCNQFGGQEPGTDAEVEQFCALKGQRLILTR
jgi:glutathione peroxidase